MFLHENLLLTFWITRWSNLKEKMVKKTFFFVICLHFFFLQNIKYMRVTEIRYIWSIYIILIFKNQMCCMVNFIYSRSTTSYKSYILFINSIFIYSFHQKSTNQTITSLISDTFTEMFPYMINRPNHQRAI